MEAHEVNHDEEQTGKCHSSEFSRRTEKRFLNLNTTLQTIKAQTS